VLEPAVPEVLGPRDSAVLEPGVAGAFVAGPASRPDPDPLAGFVLVGCVLAGPVSRVPPPVGLSVLPAGPVSRFEPDVLVGFAPELVLPAGPVSRVDVFGLLVVVPAGPLSAVVAAVTGDGFCFESANPTSRFAGLLKTEPEGVGRPVSRVGTGAVVPELGAIPASRLATGERCVVGDVLVSGVAAPEPVDAVGLSVSRPAPEGVAAA
jgi:hypothetical protein